MSTHTRLLSAGSLLLCSTALSAAPTVNGNTISWPDDGWYQVQDSSDYSQVCAGVESCTVDPGTYIVINHTSGQRFENIEVGGETQADDSGINVSGNVISWPDDGWYQVQHSDTYESICNGGSSCEVEDGSYIVINHTTGQRYPRIQVGSSSEPSADYIRVEGNTISWSDEGWHQVQSVPDYESICNGGSSCIVEPGDYVVINHVNGTRTDVLVESNDPVIPSTVTINPGNYKEIISTVLQVFTGSPEYTDDLYALPNFIEFDADTAPGEYNCRAGGTYTIDSYDTSRGNGNSLVFDECLVNASLMEGSLATYDFLGSEIVEGESFSELLAGKYGPNLSYAMSGTASRAEGQWSAQALDYYSHEFAEIENGDYSWSRVISSGGAFSTTIEGSFSYLGIYTEAGVELSVEAVDMFVQLSPTETSTSQGNYDYLDATPFMNVFPDQGTIEITASDGSRLLMNAATGDMSTVSVSLENDDVSISTLENWTEWSSELRTDVMGATR